MEISLNKENNLAPTSISRSFAGMIDANNAIRGAIASSDFIQKRGFNYTGDSSGGWGLRGGNLAFDNGFNFFGNNRGGTFSLQPFGLGARTMPLAGMGVGITPSLFAYSGSGATYSRHTHLAHTKIALSIEAYKGFGVVKNVIDLMCNFASEGLTIVHPRPSIQKFYRRWAQMVDLQGRTKDALRQYYKTANVFIFRTMGTVDEISYKKLKNAKGDRDVDIKNSNDPNSPLQEKYIREQLEKPNGKREIPWRYTLLNPLQMDVRGTKYFGGQEWVFVLDEETKTNMSKIKTKNNIDFLDDTEVNLPPEFKKLDEGGGIVKLPQDRLYTLHYMKDDHEDWADPMIWPVMNDIMYKNQLRAMDMSVANSVINAITIFKLGDIKSGYTPPPHHFAKLSEMLRTPTYSHNFVWNDAISVETHYPPIEKLLSIDKYKSVDRDILAGLGIPSILVDGAEGGNFSNAFLQVRTLMERLEEGRNEIIKWIERELRLIAAVMGHRDIPSVRFGNMSLRDEEAEKKLIIQLMDRNIVSAERVHEVFDIETEVELERMRKERDLAEDEGIMMKFGPYKDPMNMMDTEETMQLDFKHKKELNKDKPKPAIGPGSPLGQKKQVSKPNGRPPGTKVPQEKQRSVKPKGMGFLSSKASSAYDSVNAYIVNNLVEIRKVKSKKYLSAADRTDIENLTFAAFISIPPDVALDMDVISGSIANIDMDGEDIMAMEECMALGSVKLRKAHAINYYMNKWS